MTLFLYTYSINRARTSGVFYEELSRRSDGKNLRLLDISRNKLSDISRVIDKASLIVFDNSIILSMGKNEILSRNFYTNKNRNKDFYFDIWNLVYLTDKPVFLLHPSSDLHAVNFGLEENVYLEMLGKISGIFWPYHRCPLERDDSKDRYPFTSLEPFQLSKKKVLSAWDKIKSTVPISIDFPHCLSTQELIQKRPRKIWDVIIPGGANYITRSIARENATKADLFVAPFESNARWLIYIPYFLYSRVTKRKYSTPVYQKKSFRFYRQMIARSSVSFACGSELRFFVRKFIEVPAFQSAMLAYPSLDFRDYGFEDGVHYLHCFPEETGEKAKYLLQHKEVMEKLAQNAWKLVAKQHIASERVNQVLSCLHFYSKGKLKSAGYNNGKFEIN